MRGFVRCYYLKVKKKLFIVGIDEAGRGPLAGPIAVGAVAAVVKLKAKKTNFGNRRCGRAPERSEGRDKRFSKFGFLSGIKDSKKLSAKQREKWFEIIAKNFEAHVAMVGSKTIDKIGISKATKLAVARVLRKFSSRRTDLRNVLVLMDGSLFAPRRYNQKTIIKGDEKVPLIAAASIIAKVCRDRKMRKLHKNCPNYCFDIHKGYGTKLHYAMIKRSGFSLYHRRSFLKNVSVSKTSKN